MGRLDNIKVLPIEKIVRSSPKESTLPRETKNTGDIPKWIKGSMLRNGSGDWDMGGETVNHWFDGHALLHKFEISDGKVTYMNKFLRSDVYNKNTKYQRWIYGGFGTPAKYHDPCKSLFERFTSYFLPPKNNPYDNCNVSIWPMGDKLFSFTETTAMREVDPKTLDSPSGLNMAEYLTVNTQTAHPHTTENGEYLNLGSTFGKNTFYNVIKMKKTDGSSSNDLKNLEIVAKIPAEDGRKPAYYHSYGMTQNYILFLEMPYRFNLFKMLTAKLRGIPPAQALEYHEEFNSVIKVANHKTGKNLSIRLETKGMGVFHFGNAYEITAIDGTKFVVWDACPNFHSNGATHLFDIRTLRSRTSQEIKAAFEDAGANEAMRYVFPLSVPEGAKVGENLISRINGSLQTNCTATLKEDGSVWLEPEPLFDNSDLKTGFFGFEFPRYNYALNGKKYRYLYGCGFGQVLPDRLVKIDTDEKSTLFWQEENIYPSEPIFIQNPEAREIDGEDEDNGVILSICVSTDESIPIFLLVLNAKTMTEIARAETDLTGLPYGFHHYFLPENNCQ